MIPIHITALLIGITAGFFIGGPGELLKLIPFVGRRLSEVYYDTGKEAR